MTADLLRIVLFKGLVENSVSIFQTAGGLVQGNSLGEIRQDLLLPELPVNIIENFRCCGPYGTSFLPCGKYFLYSLFIEWQSESPFLKHSKDSQLWRNLVHFLLDIFTFSST